MDCDMKVGRTFDILRGAEVERAEECSVCLERPATVKLQQCTHRFCPYCVGTMLSMIRVEGRSMQSAEVADQNYQVGGVSRAQLLVRLCLPRLSVHRVARRGQG